MLLEVLVCPSILYELRGSGQYIWIGIKRDWLDHVGGEQVHQRLDRVHFRVHLRRDGVVRSEALEQCLAGEGFPLD